MSIVTSTVAPASLVPVIKLTLCNVDPSAGDSIETVVDESSVNDVDALAVWPSSVNVLAITSRIPSGAVVPNGTVVDQIPEAATGSLLKTGFPKESCMTT